MESINKSEKRQALYFIENAAESMSLPESLRSAHRMAHYQEPPESFETIALAQGSLIENYLEESKRTVSALEALDSYRVAARIGDMRELKLRRIRESQIAGNRKRWTQRDELHRAALELSYTLLSQLPESKTPSGKMRVAAVAGELAPKLFQAFPSYFTSLGDRKQKGDGRFLYDNFEKTLAKWLRDAIKKSL